MRENDKKNAGPFMIPTEIDHYIRKGMEQAKELRQNRSRHRWIRVGSSLVACLFIFVFIFSVRLSPAVAAYVSSIPGMEKIVEFLRDDKGLQLAAEHNLVQHIGASGSLEGVTFTIDHVLADEKRMLLFYTLKNDLSGKEVALHKIELFDQSGKQWEYGVSWSSMGSEDPVIRNRIDIHIEGATEIPDSMTAKVTLAIDNLEQKPPLKIDFAVDKNKFKTFEKKMYPVMKEVTVDGQRFTIEQIAVFPTQTEVSIRFDPANIKHVFDFDKLRLEDEKGETFAFWGNGVPVRDNGENGRIYNLESIYFVEPEKLILKANGIRAVDKDKLQIVIDAKAGTLTNVPNDRLKLTALRQVDDVVGMDFSLKVPPQDKDSHISLGYDLTDDVGNEYDYVQGSTHSTDDESIQYYSMLFKRKTNKGTPTSYSFPLSSYPERLQGTFSIEVK
ncbi:DUF4179 domain-containing protein [Brevibacillus antibioticus]|uniref:DUF4179 domain-containing protein n=1 Tax=Brevibacillus antibioticus TaxID=2570228 RepID=A0A4U2Y6K6_9BACL|nr:DUF4179 domain-containing protein [Brevibacillus antibioticus]TKI56157.1 DUF4179 domain-containing protein [Brevibacillus antibioticus]